MVPKPTQIRNSKLGNRIKPQTGAVIANRDNKIKQDKHSHREETRTQESISFGLLLLEQVSTDLNKAHVCLHAFSQPQKEGL